MQLGKSLRINVMVGDERLELSQADHTSLKLQGNF